MSSLSAFACRFSREPRAGTLYMADRGQLPSVEKEEPARGRRCACAACLGQSQDSIDWISTWYSVRRHFMKLCPRFSGGRSDYRVFSVPRELLSLFAELTFLSGPWLPSLLLLFLLLPCGISLCLLSHLPLPHTPPPPAWRSHP